MHLYPLLFRPIIKTMVWGQESWDISCRPLEMGVIENGAYAQMPFDKYLNLDRMQTMGTSRAHLTRFPLLIKIITAHDALSVQVHPNDDYALAQAQKIPCPTGSNLLPVEADTGKSEMWYVIQPPTEGNLIIGLRDNITRQMLHDAYKNNTVEACLNPLPVQTGDMVNIPAGLVHALTPGAVIAEIQQNSDTTYRLYDYNRMGIDGKPRELHVEHALNVTDFESTIPKTTAPNNRVQCPFFTVEKQEIKTAHTYSTGSKTFTILICAEGEATISYNGGEQALTLHRSAFLPAALGEYQIIPHNNATVLLCQ
ncbi:MAG: class I mannose-6-phosphate isomerase [Defluviitaleaceae bacterium]|nr:class I mannose-6-phosphate isomerase [Defluviitaleaceae bacterium]MCL2276071.1 class I mannose-6-phosphate isomerase [Defluviitaleaceae bacterium]